MNINLKQKFKTLKKLIGNTPLIEINYKYGDSVRAMRAKLEWFNLSGSIKDRPALEILKRAYASGRLKSGQTICETTSGNMGIAIASLAQILNNPVVVCMPKSMSAERKKLLKLLGAKLELTNNFEEAFLKAEEYKARDSFLTYQFENKNNTLAHECGTAKEIYKKLKNVPCFISGVGTGGTLMGVGAFLKQKCGAQVYAIDPAESQTLTLGKPLGTHKIQGIDDGKIPALYNSKIVDKIIKINSSDAIAMAQKLARELGLAVGISSGANFLGCVLSGVDGATTVFADDNKKYLSTDLAKKQTSELVNKIELIGYKTL